VYFSPNQKHVSRNVQIEDSLGMWECVFGGYTEGVPCWVGLPFIGEPHPLPSHHEGGNAGRAIKLRAERGPWSSERAAGAPQGEH
jgi:hypothetical protein